MLGPFSRAVAPSINSSVVSGSQKSGMPQPSQLRSEESWRSHADHREWMSIDLIAGTDYSRIRPVLVMPDAITHHRHWRRTLLIVLSVISRPIHGCTPKVLKKFPDTYCPLRVSTGAWDPALRTPRGALPACNAARSANSGV